MMSWVGGWEVETDQVLTVAFCFIDSYRGSGLLMLHSTSPLDFSVLMTEEITEVRSVPDTCQDLRVLGS